MGIFGQTLNLNSAKAPTGGGIYFTDGDYEVEITCVKMLQTRSNGPAFLGETLVLESSSPERGAGSRPTYYQGMQGDAADVAPQNIKMFMAACAGLNIFDAKDAKVIAAFDWDSFAETAVSEANPLKGCRVHVSAVTTESKKKKNPDGTPKKFTRLTFTPGKELSDFQKKLLKTAQEAASKAA